METSLGKVNTLRLMPVGSTVITSSCGRQYDVLPYPNYYSLLSNSCSSVPSTQSGLLPRLDHSKSDCHLLHFRARPRRVRDFHPLGLNYLLLSIIFTIQGTHNRYQIISLRSSERRSISSSVSHKQNEQKWQKTNHDWQD